MSLVTSIGLPHCQTIAPYLLPTLWYPQIRSYKRTVSNSSLELGQFIIVSAIRRHHKIGNKKSAIFGTLDSSLLFGV